MSRAPKGTASPPKARTSGQSADATDAKSLHQETRKTADLVRDTAEPGEAMTANQGVKIADDQHSLKAGPRGPTLMEDFLLREKITHFDHERIPERVVHARGTAAHGVFRAYEDLSDLTMASPFGAADKETPVFVRFSTVAGSRGSADTPRDVRGFAVKFYADDGIWDLVGNNIPVFFIQDAIKFPDLIHAVKPEPNNEIPQAASAHDTFWDFVSLTPESMHMLMWVMSDRALPRSLATMEGFGVHTFRMVNAAGTSRFVKFHWKPLKGVHSLVWDESQKISGKDPDFHRRDLFESIERGDYPEWELGVQVVEEADEHSFDFDLLDATKLIPEELVPVRRIGRMTLNRNPDNFFAETEQVAFHTGHVIPGIDFTNDPLLQGGCSPTWIRSFAASARTSPNCRSTGRSARCTTTSATPWPAPRSTRAALRISPTVSAMAARCTRRRRRTRSAATRRRWRERRSASAARVSPIISARRRCSGTACPTGRRAYRGGLRLRTQPGRERGRSHARDERVAGQRRRRTGGEGRGADRHRGRTHRHARGADAIGP